MRRRTIGVLVGVLCAATLGAAASPTPPGEIGGEIRIAYPEEPLSWLATGDAPPPTVDLAHLWGVPLYRYDPHGQLRPALAADAAVSPGEGGGPWSVEITLREGRWSDGEPIGARDVVATIETLQTLGDSSIDAEFTALESVEEVDARRVRFTFSEPEPRWPHLLAGARSVLPAHVLVEDGGDAYRDDVPVSAGPYRLVEHARGLRAVFERHDEGPLGPPGLDRVEIYFTPSYETALGLLDAHRVDVAMGYLGSNPVGRALRVDGVDAAAPLGGTWTTLGLLPEGSLGDDATGRAAVRDAVSVAAIVDGLLGTHGQPMTSTIPGVDGPWAVDRIGGVSIGDHALTLVIRGAAETAGVTGRMLQHHVTQAGGQAELVRLALDEQVERRVDAEFSVVRDGPRPSMAARVASPTDDAVHLAVRTGDRAWRTDDEEARAAMDALHAAAWERPLYRVGVAHAWRDELRGMRASSWPGLGLWESERWHWAPDGAPEQVETVPITDGDGP